MPELAGSEPAGVLITRPQPGADATARLVAAMGLRPVVAPVLEVTGGAPRLPSPAALQAILVTSGNAIPGLGGGHFGVPLLAVGDATARQARDAGFTEVRSARRDAEALAALVARDCSPAGKTLLLACGEGQGTRLAADLRQSGFRVIRRIAYAAAPVRRLSEAAQSSLAGNDLKAALFFSPATARAFVALFRQAPTDYDLGRVEALAISPATAAALTPLAWRRVRVASHPNQDELLAMLR